MGNSLGFRSRDLTTYITWKSRVESKLDEDETPFGWYEFPIEIVLKVFLDLEFADLVVCAQVCRLWRCVAADNLLQKKFSARKDKWRLWMPRFRVDHLEASLTDSTLASLRDAFTSHLHENGFCLISLPEMKNSPSAAPLTTREAVEAFFLTRQLKEKMANGVSVNSDECGYQSTFPETLVMKWNWSSFPWRNASPAETEAVSAHFVSMHSLSTLVMKIVAKSICVPGKESELLKCAEMELPSYFQSLSSLTAQHTGRNAAGGVQLSEQGLLCLLPSLLAKNERDAHPYAASFELHSRLGNIPIERFMLPGDILVFPGRTFERLTAGYIHAPTYSALRMEKRMFVLFSLQYQKNQRFEMRTNLRPEAVQSLNRFSCGVVDLSTQHTSTATASHSFDARWREYNSSSPMYPSFIPDLVGRALQLLKPEPPGIM